MNTPSPAKSLPLIHAADGNLFVGQLCDLGLTISFSPNGCQAQDLQMGQAIGTDRKVGRLFELLSLQFPLPSSISAPVTDSDTY
ncbi:Retrovirus-related Pol polyprotein from transposon TNT 1-94 [Cucumis melo var. makuwa]|uniref:Retrovirus-related Pol polyprotein from transposon TNT 1-94 n=1 Tax=Cucumis melo var. makuwa TaxID=1194695 RepID=A0A5A7SNA7_CUCMM|nr:Retrovirus-related Pol polyprotein from transposon TNT 1-94 [Cucumis melo var. makuwa]